MSEKRPDTPHARNVTQTVLRQNFYRFDELELEPRSLRHDGYIARIRRDLFCMKPAVNILLYNPLTDEVLLNQQFRTGAFARGDDPFMFECCAGLIDDGETPEETAAREIREETGCDVIALEPMGKYYPSPGGTDEVQYLFIGCIHQAHTGVFGEEDEGEEIKTHLFPAQKVIDMMDNQEITNAMAALMINWFARHRDRLRLQWKNAA